MPLTSPKLIQVMWMLGGAVFMLALVHSLSGGQTKEWVTSAISNAHAPEVAAGGPGRESLQNWMRRAERNWGKSVRQRHDLIKQDWPTAPDNMDMFPAVSRESYSKTPYSIWDFVPASYSCPHEVERIGRMGDGGKWVCGFHKYEELAEDKKCVIYSFGVQFESSYEDETLSRTNCEIWAYDFSVVDFGKQLTTANRARAHFTQAGIAGHTDPTRTPPYWSIQDLMKENGHDYIDVLKIDIEFAEFASLTSLSAAFPQRFPIGQLLIEIHLFGDINKNGDTAMYTDAGFASAPHAITSGEFLKWWELLERRGMRPAWTEPNLLYSTLNIEPAKEPRLAEYTFINVLDERSVLFEGLTKDS